jgi:hypothetical protein
MAYIDDDTQVKASAGDIQEKIARSEVITMFATADKGLRLQERFSLSDKMLGLLGLNVPNIFLSVQGNQNNVQVSCA